jgi:hypothetical protein
MIILISQKKDRAYLRTDVGINVSNFDSTSSVVQKSSPSPTNVPHHSVDSCIVVGVRNITDQADKFSPGSSVSIDTPTQIVDHIHPSKPPPPKSPSVQERVSRVTGFSKSPPISPTYTAQ